jgi:hypothetical protein
MEVSIFENGAYETDKGEKIKIVEIWYGKNSRIVFQIGDTVFTRSRKIFEDGIRNKKIIKKLF